MGSSVVPRRVVLRIRFGSTRSTDEIDDYVELWHIEVASEGIVMPALQVFLGFSEAELLVLAHR
jgi:hypothetical protein